MAQQLPIPLRVIPGAVVGGSNSSELMYTIFRRGDRYSWEDVVCNGWDALLQVAFPRDGLVTSGRGWLVSREAYRDGPNPPPRVPPKRPDFAIVRLVRQPNPPAPPAPLHLAWDVMWLECKAPSWNTPSRWHTMIKQITARLALAHPRRPIPVLLAVGYRCIWLLWDPTFTVMGLRWQITVAGEFHRLNPAWTPFLPPGSSDYNFPNWLYLDRLRSPPELFLYPTDGHEIRPWEWPTNLRAQEDLRALDDCLLRVHNQPLTFPPNPVGWQA